MCNSFDAGFQPFVLTVGLHRAYSSNLLLERAKTLRIADHPSRWRLRISERLLRCFCVLLGRQLLAQEAFQHFWCDIEGGGLETRYTGTKIKQPQCGSFL